MSRNLPCRVTSSTSVPSSADSGGSKVFSALNAAMWTLAMARPSSRPLQVEGQRFHLGQLGHAPSLGGDPRPTVRSPGSAATLDPCTRSRPLPAAGEVFLDARGGGRALRVSWHPEADMVVLSLWRDSTCAGHRSGCRSTTCPT